MELLDRTVDTGTEVERMVVDNRIDVDDEAGLEVAPLPVHVPKAELQPVPQCAVVEPLVKEVS